MVLPLRVIEKLFVDESRKVLFCAPFVLVVFSSRVTYLKKVSVADAAAAFREARTPWRAPAIYVSPLPEIIQLVLVTLMAVATPNAASVLLPVVPAPARYIVSDVMAIVTVLIMFTNVITVPTG